jgi:aminoglycoside phosphotransferase (APT) family kinase protein
MAREFRVISGLAPTPVPVPGAFLFHDDTTGEAGVGTPFYLMEHVDGRVLSSSADNADLAPEQLRALSLELAARLADLHAVDPDAVGLGDLGRPDGFLERQVRRWGKQYALSRSRELPDLDLLQDRLSSSVPATTHSSLIHGDYRLDNAIVRLATGEPGASPTIAAILDWEMATIGDSFTDLGLLDLYWDIRSVVETSGTLEAGAVAPSAVEPGRGYPEFAELVDTYARARGIGVPDLSWYRAFAAYKLAIILEGIHFRFRAGETVGAGFETVGGMVPLLAADGLRTLGVATPITHR